ncbi:MAG: 2-phospho-L-lactate transferase [Pseudomonadales bacterium]|nr:2-phospho-L-lactate transferase [Pseudomonadales bacterium]
MKTPDEKKPDAKYLALCGGVGGAKLALGLSHVLSPGQLTIMVNTGDDFEHLGLHISPDIDTVCYTLAGRSHKERGWGLENESWQMMSTLTELGGENWFQLGDRDLGLHLYRSRALARGESLTAVTQHICSSFGVKHTVIPMSDDPVRTMIGTERGELAFQHYFVREQCRPEVRSFCFRGAETAQLNPLCETLLNDRALKGIIVCPSNPFISIDPILATGQCREKLIACGKPLIVVSPIIAGQAIKGPTAKIMNELKVPCSSLAIAKHYSDIASTIIIDDNDRDEAQEIEQVTGIRVSSSATLMKSEQDKINLAMFVLSQLQTGA